MDRKLLSIAEAADLLGVSRITFNKIRKEKAFTEVPIGQRVRFYKDEIMAALQPNKQSVAPVVSTRRDIILNIFSLDTVADIELKKNTFDLTALKQIDPYGAVSLLCVILDRVRSENNVHLIVDEGLICQTLKAHQFFLQVEARCGGKVSWDKNVLYGSTFHDNTMLMPITAVTNKGAERSLAEELVVLLRKQGFHDSVGRGIAQIIGELADNAMTHSAQALGDRICWVAAQRFLYREKNCIIVGLADPGLGIFSTLKTKAEYKALTDSQALLKAFRPFVTSWEAARGKGLTDVLGIALGNNSYLHADVCNLSLQMDFHDGGNPEIKFGTPLADVTGTRFGLILIDNYFVKKSREEVDKMLEEKERQM